MNESYNQVTDYVTLTTGHQEGLILAGLVCHFQKNCRVPGEKSTGDENLLAPSTDVIGYLSKTSSLLQGPIASHRLRYIEEMKLYVSLNYITLIFSNFNSCNC